MVSVAAIGTEDAAVVLAGVGVLAVGHVGLSLHVSVRAAPLRAFVARHLQKRRREKKKKDGLVNWV